MPRRSAFSRRYFDVEEVAAVDHELQVRAHGLRLVQKFSLVVLEEPVHGGVLINDVPTFRVDNFPYGGVKDSGFGREGVRFALEEMSEPKVLILRGL